MVVFKVMFGFGKLLRKKFVRKFLWFYYKNLYIKKSYIIKRIN